MQNFPGHPPFQRGTKKGETLIQRIWVNLGSLGGPEIMVTLWYIICYIANMAIEIVDLPTKNGDFP